MATGNPAVMNNDEEERGGGSRNAPQLTCVVCIGAGYIGGPTMAVAAKYLPDTKFIVVDRDARRIDAWNSSAELPIYEPGLHEMVLACRGKNLFFTCDTAAAVREADIIFIAVNTPNKDFGSYGMLGFDLTMYEGAARDIAKYTEPGSSKVIVEKSTVPVKTAAMLRKVLNATKRSSDIHFEVVSNPEFLAEGTAIVNLEKPDRIVIGADNTPEGKAAAEKLVGMYLPWIPRERIFVVGTETSELTKLSANAFLSQRISSINAMSALCEKTGADVSELAKCIGADRRIGPHFLNCSVGFGGSCFGKDLNGLVYICESMGLPEVAEYWRQVLKINEWQKKRFAHNMISNMFGSVRGKNICVLGFAFKKDTGDTRDSAAIDIVRELLSERANVFIYDPKVSAAVINQFFPTATVEKTPYAAACGAHAVAVVTEWDEFKSLDWGKIYSTMVKPAFIFDGRNLLDHNTLGTMGYKVYAVGKSLSQFSI